MDSLGEVGKKMRSAIKAKLVELGNASPTGYIDDELPDYVMIMVANKRSKQQMLTDLNLFLGSNTETFVTWLHQVLQKLQEVTLPTSLASKAKKKISETSKKDKKKDKKKAKEPSITDVIAVELMEKAKKTIDPKLKNEKMEKSRTPSPPPVPESDSNSEKQSTADKSSSQTNKDDELNFPIISEIQKQQQNSNMLHRKELAQLEDINNKIHERKRKLITLNNTEKSAEKSPDVQMRDADSPDKSVSTQKEKPLINSRLSIQPPTASSSEKSNIISLSAIRRSETEFLKKIVVKQKEDNEHKLSRTRTDSSSRGRRLDRRSDSRERRRNSSNRDRIRRRSRSRSLEKSHHRDGSRNRLSIRERIGSRIKTSSSSSKHSRTPETDGNFKVKHRAEFDGNFKVKQRPALSSTITAHAGKSLLLRAMADAQRSTQASSESKKKQQRDNIVVKVKNEKRNLQQNHEEYVPESISGHSESEAEYHPSSKSQENNNEDDGDVVYLNNNDDADLDDLDDNNENSSTKLVITLKQKEKSKSPTPPKVIKRRKTPVKDRIGRRNAQDRQTKDDSYRPKKRSSEQVEDMEVEECESQRAYNKVKKARVSPIRFDLTDEECDDKSRGSSLDRSEKKISKKDSENGEAKKIKLDASRSFDHVPSLLSSIAVPVPDSAKPVIKNKERCKYHPNCSNRHCTFYHPATDCKQFPNCKFGDSCMFTHPMCKFNTTCTRSDCNFSHTSILANSTPLIPSSIVPAQNYKSIKLTPSMTTCKYFSGCTNSNCIYQHPKMCKFGKSCANIYNNECNFWHPETASKNKFRWVSNS